MKSDDHARRGAGRKKLALALGTALSLLTLSAGAVTILDSTWREEGGAKGRESAGFGAHLRLAAQPQFRAVLALTTDGESWGEASGTWIGNDDKHAYILTSAHIYELPAKPAAYSVRSPDGRILQPDRIWVHPQWNGDTDTRTGFDLVVLRLPAPLQSAGASPLLYGGQAEAGQLITFVGFGSRGIGSTGEKDSVPTRRPRRAWWSNGWRQPNLCSVGATAATTWVFTCPEKTAACRTRMAVRPNPRRDWSACWARATAAAPPGCSPPPGVGCWWRSTPMARGRRVMVRRPGSPAFPRTEPGCPAFSLACGLRNDSARLAGAGSGFFLHRCASFIQGTVFGERYPIPVGRGCVSRTIA